MERSAVTEPIHRLHLQLFGLIKSQAEGPLAIFALVVIAIAALWLYR
jgi:hypothetical protein